MLSHWVGVGEWDEINHFKVRKGSCTQFISIHPSIPSFILCAFVIQKNVSGTLPALKQTTPNLIPPLQVLSGPPDQHVQDRSSGPQAEQMCQASTGSVGGGGRSGV